LGLLCVTRTIMTRGYDDEAGRVTFAQVARSY